MVGFNVKKRSSGGKWIRKWNCLICRPSKIAAFVSSQQPFAAGEVSLALSVTWGVPCKPWRWVSKEMWGRDLK